MFMGKVGSRACPGSQLGSWSMGQGWSLSRGPQGQLATWRQGSEDRPNHVAASLGAQNCLETGRAALSVPSQPLMVLFATLAASSGHRGLTTQGFLA